MSPSKSPLFPLPEATRSASHPTAYGLLPQSFSPSAGTTFHPLPGRWEELLNVLSSPVEEIKRRELQRQRQEVKRIFEAVCGSGGWGGVGGCLKCLVVRRTERLVIGQLMLVGFFGLEKVKEMKVFL